MEYDGKSFQLVLLVQELFLVEVKEQILNKLIDLYPDQFGAIAKIMSLNYVTIYSDQAKQLEICADEMPYIKKFYAKLSIPATAISNCNVYSF